MKLMPYLPKYRKTCGEGVPWALIEPHAAQARANHYQKLERLAQRGGLAPSEALAILEDCQWARFDEVEAATRISKMVALSTPAAKPAEEQ